MSALRNDIVQLIRTGSGPAPSGVRLVRQRARLVQSLRPRSAAGAGSWRRVLAFSMVLGLGSAAAAAAFYAFSDSAPETRNAAGLTAQLENSVLPQGGWIETETKSQTLRFSEGSSIDIEEHSKARLGPLDSTHADLTLESGALHADITKHTGVRWTIAAGPYRVQVVGTRFDVAWDFARERFSVAVSEGKVRVLGGDLPATGVTLTPGQSLSRARKSQAVQPAGRGSPTKASKAATPEPNAARRPEPATTVDSWQKLARQGRYDQALSRARGVGLDRLLSTLAADDLLLLANTARYAADTGTAKSAFIKLRERHPGHSAAHLAAFSLGRLASDVEGNPTSAARWFRTFLQESPRGDLAAGARARLMSTLLKLNDRRGAHEVARDYLKYHPGGPHSKTARSLVSSSQNQ